MKVLLVILFAGYASASFYDDFNKASDDVVDSFMHGMAQAPPLHMTLGIEDSEIVRRLENDVQDELAKYLKDAFERTLKKIDQAYKDGKKVNEEAWQRLKELKEKMNELKIEDHEAEKFKKQLDVHLREILKKMGILDKRAINEPIQGEFFEDLNFRNFVIKLKQMVLENMDASTLKKSLAKVVGQASQSLCQWLTSKGQEKVLNFFDRALDQDEEKRSVSGLYDQVSEYFKDLDLELKQKFSRFGEWVKNVVDQGLVKSRSKIENVRTIAKQLIDKTKVVSKEVAAEALEYLADYKEELGSLYDELRDKITKKILDYTD